MENLINVPLKLGTNPNRLERSCHQSQARNCKTKIIRPHKFRDSIENGNLSRRRMTELGHGGVRVQFSTWRRDKNTIQATVGQRVMTESMGPTSTKTSRHLTAPAVQCSGCLAVKLQEQTAKIRFVQSSSVVCKTN